MLKILCYSCKNYKDCDVLIKIKNISDIYNLYLDIKIYQCSAYKKVGE